MSKLQKNAAIEQKLVSRIIKQIDEVAPIVGSSSKRSLNAIRETVVRVGGEADDILENLSGVLANISDYQRQLSEGTLIGRLTSTEEALEGMTRKREWALNAWRRTKEKYEQLKNYVVELEKNYKEALDIALKEKGVAQDAVRNLSAEIKRLASELKAAQDKAVEALKKAANLTRQLDKAKAATSAAKKETQVYKTKLEELQKRYSKLVRESVEAEEAVEAAKEAGAPRAVIQGMESVARSKTQAAEVAEEALEQAGKKAEVPTSKVKPKEKTKTTAPKKKTVREEVSRGVREAVRRRTRGAIEEGIGRVGKGLISIPIKIIKGIAILGFLGVGVVAGGAALWYLYTKQDPDKTRRQAEDFDSLLRDAHAKLFKVNFRPGSTGEKAQQSYLRTMEACFGLLPQMFDRRDDEAFINNAGQKLLALFSQTESFLGLKDVYSEDLVSADGWIEALRAIQEIQRFGSTFANDLNKIVSSEKSLYTQEAYTPTERGESSRRMGRPAPSPEDQGIDILGRKFYLSQHPELDPATRSAAPYLIKRVLLSPTGLSFWDPENRWGGGYLSNRGDLNDQVVRHLRFLMNPRSIDSDWAYGPINNSRKLRKFMRKNMPKAGRRPASGYKSTRRKYRKEEPKMAFSSNTDNIIVESAMKNNKKIANLAGKNSFSTNKKDISMMNIEKFADSMSKEFYQDALRGLDDQYAKSYYTGLKSMYDQKLGGKEADYRSLYQPNGGTGIEILENSHPKSIVVSDAMGQGGLVENVLEQQRKDIGVALSTPTGNFRGKHANLVESLTKIANNADKKSFIDESDIIDKAIEDIVTILKS